jgi:hypothetical protein
MNVSYNPRACPNRLDVGRKDAASRMVEFILALLEEGLKGYGVLTPSKKAKRPR